jgi:altronate hydrolase
VSRALVIHADDSVAVATAALPAGVELELDGTSVVTLEPIPAGHKLSRRAHAAGEAVIKYGFPIGRATADIAAGAHVHSHNLATALTAEAEAAFAEGKIRAAEALPATFGGFRRADGRVGTRNELWIVPTVGCVARTAEALATAFRSELGRFPNVGGVHAFSHPFGCSQLGDDLANTQRILAALASHPNAGGALVLGLGCENNHLAAFQAFLGDADPSGCASCRRNLRATSTRRGWHCSRSSPRARIATSARANPRRRSSSASNAAAAMVSPASRRTRWSDASRRASLPAPARRS